MIIGINRNGVYTTILDIDLIRTNRRLTFDIKYQHPDFTFDGEDDGNFPVFTASNGYQIISRSRMDIQTERMWLNGGIKNEHYRSGSMVFPDNDKRDGVYCEFVAALREWQTEMQKLGQWKEKANV